MKLLLLLLPLLPVIGGCEGECYFDPYQERGRNVVTLTRENACSDSAYFYVLVDGRYWNQDARYQTSSRLPVRIHTESGSHTIALRRTVSDPDAVDHSFTVDVTQDTTLIVPCR